MRALGLRWLGVATSEHDAMLRFLRDVLGLRSRFDEPTTTELSLPNGDRFQLFAPGHEYFDLYVDDAHGPVALFEVDDVHGARAELETAGIEIVGDFGRDSSWDWLHFRAPDGNLYALASRHPSGD